MKAVLTAMLSFLVLAAPLTSAPAPQPKNRPQEIAAGRWIMSWAGKWSVGLERSGLCATQYAGSRAGSVWHGSWAWDRASRTLSVSESCGNSSMVWRAVLDHDLKGETDSGIRIHFERDR